MNCNLSQRQQLITQGGLPLSALCQFSMERSTASFSTKSETTYGNVPSVKELMASFRWGFCARYFKVTSGSPSRIMRCTIIMLLKTMVHVESRNRFVRARKISATPASPACVATSMCSTYLDFGAASYMYQLVCCCNEPTDRVMCRKGEWVGRRIATLILVPPFTLFSKELAMNICRGVLLVWESSGCWQMVDARWWLVVG
jgi:hypothetical protein